MRAVSTSMFEQSVARQMGTAVMRPSKAITPQLTKASALLQTSTTELFLKLTTVSDFDSVQGLIHPVCFCSLNLLYHIHALNNLPKHHMLPIQVSTWHCANEELAAICTGSCKQLQHSVQDSKQYCLSCSYTMPCP